MEILFANSASIGHIQWVDFDICDVKCNVKMELKRPVNFVCKQISGSQIGFQTI